MSGFAEAASEPPASHMTLAVGTLVVYGSFGIGRVSRLRPGRTRGSRSGLVSIELPSGLSVTLSLEQARGCLRPLSGDTELTLVQQTLRSHDPDGEETWQNRTKRARSKIVAGDPVALAEVVRDAARRQETPAGKVAQLSTKERELYLQARQLLAAELAVAQGTTPTAADDWIERQLCDDGEPPPAPLAAERSAFALGRAMRPPGSSDRD